MVGVISRFALGGFGIIKRNPIKTIAIAALLGCAIGLFFLGRSVINEYNDTIARIENVEEENRSLTAELNIQKQTQVEILERMSDVEQARDRLREQIRESQNRIRAFSSELEQLNLELSPPEDAEDEVNRTWRLVTQCMEEASRNDTWSKECESLLQQD